MPRKPTQPFENVQWSPDGSVRRNVYCLPEDKEMQEEAAFRRFADLLKECYETVEIGDDVDSLPEDDHDFRVSINGQLVHIQLTELSPREYRQSGSNSAAAVDHGAADVALRRVITNKVDKHYGTRAGPAMVGSVLH